MLFTLILLDGYLDLPQDLFAALTDGRPQLCHCVQGVEVEHTQKVLVLKMGFRLQTAAGHKHIGGADGSRLPELYSDVDTIIRLQETSVNDTGQLTFMLFPIVPRQHRGDLFQLVGKSVLARDAKAFFQSGGHNLLMFRAVLPQPGAAGVFLLAGVSHIKDIANSVFAGAGVDEGNALGPPHHIPAHLLVPEVIVCTGGGLRALGVDKKLFVKRIFV